MMSYHLRTVKRHNSSYHCVELLPVSNTVYSHIMILMMADIAASAYGRDYLAKKSEGQTLINLYCKTLSETPMEPSWYVT